MIRTIKVKVHGFNVPSKDHKIYDVEIPSPLYSLEQFVKDCREQLTKQHNRVFVCFSHSLHLELVKT